MTFRTGTLRDGFLAAHTPVWAVLPELERIFDRLDERTAALLIECGQNVGGSGGDPRVLMCRGGENVGGERLSQICRTDLERLEDRFYSSMVVATQARAH